jgi:hypothetical protein
MHLLSVSQYHFKNTTRCFSTETTQAIWNLTGCEGDAIFATIQPKEQYLFQIERYKCVILRTVSLDAVMAWKNSGSVDVATRGMRVKYEWNRGSRKRIEVSSNATATQEAYSERRREERSTNACGDMCEVMTGWMWEL